MFSSLFKHRASDQLSREQASFFIRDAQNGAVEMGKLLQQVASASHPDISWQCARLLQLNNQVGDVLQQVQKSLK